MAFKRNLDETNFDNSIVNIANHMMKYINNFFKLLWLYNIILQWIKLFYNKNKIIKTYI